MTKECKEKDHNNEHQAINAMMTHMPSDALLELRRQQTELYHHYAAGNIVQNIHDSSYALIKAEQVLGQDADRNYGIMPRPVSSVTTAIVPLAVGLLTATALKERTLSTRILAGVGASVATLGIELITAVNLFMSSANQIKAAQSKMLINHADAELKRREESGAAQANQAR